MLTSQHVARFFLVARSHSFVQAAMNNATSISGEATFLACGTVIVVREVSRELGPGVAPHLPALNTKIYVLLYNAHIKFIHQVPAQLEPNRPLTT